MRIVNNDNYAFGFIFGYVNFPKHSVSLVAKKSWKFDLAGNLTELEDGPVLEGDVIGKGAIPECQYDADLAVYKPNAEVLLTGTCYVPNGQNKTVFDCAFKVGEWAKVLAVVGNRTWIKKLLGSKMSDPEPFTKVNLTWAHAFGGEKISANPAGTGFKRGMLPNTEYADSLVKGAGDKPAPATFGPINRQWKPRAGKMGTCDKKWLKERWPAQAADFDWSYFSSASPDQQIDGFLRGDEEVELVHMNAQQARINFNLVGQKPRLFFRNIDDETTIEAPMNLDTVFVDAENMLVHAVWRGVNNIADDEWTQCDAIVVASDSVRSPATAESFYPLFIEEIDEEEDEPEEDKKIQTIEEFQADMDAHFKLAEDTIKKQTEGFLQKMKGEFPQHFNAAALSGGQPADINKIPDALRAAIKNATASGAKLPPEMNQLANEVESSLKGVDTNDDEVPETPPLAMIKSGEAAGGDFTDIDLSGEDLSGADLTDATFTNVNLSGANLSNANLTGAVFQGSSLEGASLEKAKLNEASLNGCNLKSVNFTHAQADAAQLQECDATEAVFNESKFTNASISKLQAQGTDWSSADISGSDISECNLGKAGLQAVAAAGTSFTDCLLIEAVFDAANLTGASFAGETDATGLSAREIEAAESSWNNTNLAGSDFVKANLSSAQLANCNLEGANLSAVQLPGSNLIRSNFKNATMVGTNLFQAMMTKADLTGANLMAANLFEADLFQVVSEGANLSDAKIKRTLLEK